MKKLFFTLFSLCGMVGLNAQTYTDITPEKFDFSKYEAGKIETFWDYSAKLGHNPALDASNAEGFFKKATTADFTDGYAYFYFNQDAQPQNFTYIETVEGVGNVLKFGDTGHNAGFGGCFFAPVCEQHAGLMRTTMVFRLVGGEKNSNANANITVGIRNLANEGPDLEALSYPDLAAATAEGKWYKAVIEHNPTYALRVNYAQIIWGDNIEIAQIKFEAVTDVPEGYAPVKEMTVGTAEELGIAADEPGEESGELTYTDITPNKFDFSNYELGSIDNFWNAVKVCNHAVANDAKNENSVMNEGQAAAFDDGFAYFYFNNATDPNTYTQIAKVDGVGNVLQFGDAGMNGGFGGSYFVPTSTQTDGYMRSTIIFRVLKGEKNSNTNATMNVGIRNIAGEGPDMKTISYTDLLAQAEADNWYKAVIEYCPTYSLRFNFSQLIWGNIIQIAQIKFETMTNVPKEYIPIQGITSGTAKEVGISEGSTAISNISVKAPQLIIDGNTVNFGVDAVVYTATGAKVAQGTSAQLQPGLYIANINGKGVKFIVK